MRKKLWGRLAAILFLAVFMGLISAPYSSGSELKNYVPDFFTKFTFHLGLDLQGGTQLVYDIDLSKVPAERERDILSGVEEVIRRRVDGLGVTEPVIQTSSVGVKKHIIVELPGIKDIQEAIEAVGKVVQLKFKEEKTELTDEEIEAISGRNLEIKKEADELLAEIKTQEVYELKKTATTSKNGYFKEGKDPVALDKIDPVIADKLENWADLKNDMLYPEVIESDNQYSIVHVKTVEDTEEKEVSVSHILVSYKGAERAADTIARTKEAAFARVTEAKKKLDEGVPFATVSTEYSDDDTARENDGVLDAPIRESSSPYHEKFTEGALLLEKNQISDPVETPFGYHLILARDVQVIKSKKVVFDEIEYQKESEVPTGWADTALTGEHFDFASASFDPHTLAPIINIQFNESGKDLFAEITKRNLQKPLAIFLDDKPIIGEEVYAPIVQAEITDGKAVITGIQSLEQASILAQNLNTGAIPAPISLIGQSTVGATLGKDALNQALKAGLIGLIIVAIYMILYYRFTGLVAVLALSIYAVILTGLIKIFGVTLTLAGIAGIILSIGMAVDANVLIFERMKEELKLGKSLHIALEEGFRRAWNSIRDSNVSSLITCTILFIFGTGIIRGFAITLALGILVSMFSAITVTRNLLRIMISGVSNDTKYKYFLPFTKNND